MFSYTPLLMGRDLAHGLPAYPARENQSENTSYAPLSSIELNKFLFPLTRAILV